MNDESKNFNMDEWKKQIVNHLQEKIKSNHLNYEDFKNIISAYQDLALEFQKILESAWKLSKGEDKEKFRRLYAKFSNDIAGELTEQLYRIGRNLKKEEEKLTSTFNNIGYRILERTRLGLRDEVCYMIVRAFYTNNKEVPEKLAEAFKPVYSEELFKTFIYSFLSGILGETKTEGGEEE
jgi:hypothetical protein